MDETIKKQRKYFKQGQILLNSLAGLILNKAIEDRNLRKAIFKNISRETLAWHLLTSQTGF